MSIPGYACNGILLSSILADSAHLERCWKGAYLHGGLPSHLEEPFRLLLLGLVLAVLQDLAQQSCLQR